jgi:hypothetical protein
MDVIGHIYVSLHKSTDQLHDRLGSRSACACSEAGFSSQHGDRAIKRTAFCCRSLWVKGLNAKDIRKEMFPIYGAKCWSPKAVHNWIEKFSQRLSKVADDETELRKWLRQQLRDISAAGFDSLVKRSKVYQCWRRICREINVFFFQV